MERLLHDIRLAARALAHRPLFSGVVVATLALAIAASTVIFTMVNVLALRPLPFEEPDRLVFVWSSNPAAGLDKAPISLPDLADLTERSRALSSAGGFTPDRFDLAADGAPPAKVDAYRATAGFFRTIGVGAVAGRLFTAGEDVPGGARVVVLSHGFWSRHFAGDPTVVGRSLRLDGEPYEVVGVLDPALEFGALREIEVWTPLAMDRAAVGRDARGLLGMARLAPAATVESAQAEIDGLARAIAAEHPETNEGWGALLVPVREELAAGSTRQTAGLLALAVALLLAVACANVGNLMLLRGAGRQGELVLRASLGADRGLLVRQLLIESLLLAGAAGAIALLLARLGLRLLVRFTGGGVALFNEMTIDVRVVLFVVLVTLLAPMLFGLLPALRSARVDLAGSLKKGSVRLGDGGRSRARRVLVGLQVALAQVLIVLSLLVLRSVWSFYAVEPGFETADLLTFEIDLPDGAYDEAAAAGFFRQLEERLAALPGSERVALIDRRPIVAGPPGAALEIAGRAAAAEAPEVGRSVVTPGFLGTLELPLLRGRGLTDADAGGPPVALVNRAAAERHWSGGDPLGARLRLDGEGEWLEVVGIVGDVRNSDVESPPEPTVYVPLARNPRHRMAALVRTDGDPAALAGTVRALVASLDPDLPVVDLRSMEQIVDEDLADSVAIAGLFSLFALIALLLAVAGMYGVVAYSVKQRGREIGIRMALGAGRARIRGMVLRQGATVLVAGLVAGVAAALAGSRLVANLLFEVRPTDPGSFLAATVLLASAGLLSIWIPARGASLASPQSALREG
ncbi:MAG TPA: ABC transporter permease [Thermoanaerobaculia bacterium]